MPDHQTPAQLAYEAWVRSKESPPLPDATLATLLDRLEALSLFVGYDPAGHAPLDEIVTIEDRLRTIDTAVELIQGQLDEVLALLKGGRHV
jgi:hypothetical protein